MFPSISLKIAPDPHRQGEPCRSTLRLGGATIPRGVMSRAFRVYNSSLGRDGIFSYLSCFFFFCLAKLGVREEKSRAKRGKTKFPQGPGKDGSRTREVLSRTRYRWRVCRTMGRAEVEYL